MQGVINKRARARLRSRRSLNPPKPTLHALVRSVALGCNKSGGGVDPSKGRSETNPITDRCSFAIVDSGVKFSLADQDRASRNHNIFPQLPRDCSATIEQVANSSAGTRGYLDSDPAAMMKVGKEVVPNQLCGLWARKAISAVADLPEWERIVQKLIVARLKLWCLQTSPGTCP